MQNETLTVAEVDRRLTATRDELNAIEGALASLPAKRELLLGADIFNEAALRALEEEEVSLSRKAEYLRRRLPVLETHRESEEAKAAQARITSALLPESQSLRAEYDKVLASFHKTATALENAANKLVDLYKEIQARHDEQEFLLARYGAFDVQRADLADVGEMPNTEDLAKQIFDSIRLLRRSWEHGSSSSPWVRKLIDWQESQDKVDTWQTSKRAA